MSDLDLVRAYLDGASIRQLAQMRGESYGSIRTQLLISQVPLRRRGGDRRSPAARAAYGGLTGQAGADRYRAAVERGDIPGTGTPSSASRPTARRGARRPSRPEWRGSPRPSPRAASRRGETVDVERLRTQMLDALERCDERQRQVDLESIPAHELELAAEAFKAAVDDVFTPGRD